jgi:hypothetical protein
MHAPQCKRQRANRIPDGVANRGASIRIPREVRSRGMHSHTRKTEIDTIVVRREGLWLLRGPPPGVQRGPLPGKQSGYAQPSIWRNS